jgi:hypothetical protein
VKIEETNKHLNTLNFCFILFNSLLLQLPEVFFYSQTNIPFNRRDPFTSIHNSFSTINPHLDTNVQVLRKVDFIRAFFDALHLLVPSV